MFYVYFIKNTKHFSVWGCISGCSCVLSYYIKHGSMMFLIQCCLRTQRSRTFNCDFRPCPLHTKISSDFLTLNNNCRLNCFAMLHWEIEFLTFVWWATAHLCVQRLSLWWMLQSWSVDLLTLVSWFNSDPTFFEVCCVSGVELKSQAQQVVLTQYSKEVWMPLLIPMCVLPAAARLSCALFCMWCRNLFVPLHLAAVIVQYAALLKRLSIIDHVFSSSSSWIFRCLSLSQSTISSLYRVVLHGI